MQHLKGSFLVRDVEVKEDAYHISRWNYVRLFEHASAAYILDEYEQGIEDISASVHSNGLHLRAGFEVF